MKKNFKNKTKNTARPKPTPNDSNSLINTGPIEGPSVREFDDGKFNLPFGPGVNLFPSYLNNSKFPFGTIFPDIGGVYYWMQGDNTENFKKNKRKQKSNWKYLTKPVTYTLNQHGFRAPEWDQIDWKNSVVLFGDSCTYGIGISDDETIGFQLEQLLGRPVINLGIGGGSNALMIQNATNLLEYFPTPYAVANIWSTTNRFKFFTEQCTYDTGPWNKSSVHVSKHVDVTKLWQLTFADPTHELALSFYEGRIGKAIWQDRTKYASLSFFGDTAHYTRSDNFFKIDNQARDLIHPGEESCKRVAQFLYEKFK